MRAADSASQSSVSQIHQLRAAGVGDIGNVHAAPPSCEVPGKKGVDVAEKEVARLGLRARSGHMVQHPADFERAEISRQRQAGLGAEAVGSAIAREFGDGYRRPACPARPGRWLTGLPVWRSHKTVVSR